MKNAQVLLQQTDEVRDERNHWCQRAEEDGLESGFLDLLELYLQEKARAESLRDSRFYQKLTGENNVPARLERVSLEAVIEAFRDGQGWREFMYLDDNCLLHGVLCDNLGSDISSPDDFYKAHPSAVYCWSRELTANGEVVGLVTFRDY